MNYEEAYLKMKQVANEAIELSTSQLSRVKRIHKAKALQAAFDQITQTPKSAVTQSAPKFAISLPVKFLPSQPIVCGITMLDTVQETPELVMYLRIIKTQHSMIQAIGALRRCRVNQFGAIDPDGQYGISLKAAAELVRDRI